MKKFRKLILGAVTAAAAAVMSLCAVPDGVLPGFSVVASAEDPISLTQNTLPNLLRFETAAIYRLDEDIEITDNTLQIIDDVTFILNGHNITINQTNGQDAVQVYENKSFVIQGTGNFTANALNTTYGNGIRCYGGASLTIENGPTVTFTSAAGGWYKGIVASNGTGQTLTIDNATVTNTTLDGSGFSNATITNSTISGSTVTGGTIKSSTVTNSTVGSEEIEQANFNENGDIIYTVTFDSKGGSSVSYKIATKDSTITVPDPAPTREGYTFKGWYNNEACTGDPFDFDNTTITGYTTLYAKWLKNITYIDADGNEAVFGDDDNEDYTLVTSSDDDVKLSAGTYVVADDVTVKTLTLTGDVNIIVCNDCGLVVNNKTDYWGRNIEGENYTLNVFAQKKKTDEESRVGCIVAINCTVKALNLYGGGIDFNNFTAQSFTQKCGFINVGDMRCPSISLDWSSSGDQFYAEAFDNTTNNINLVKGFSFDDGGALYSGTLTSEQISAIAGKTLYPACKFTIQGTAPVGVRLNDNGTVTPPTTNPGLTIDGWYTNENLTGDKYNFEDPVTTNTEFYGKYYSVSYIDENGQEKSTDTFTLVTSSDEAVEWTAGTYVVADDVAINGGVTLTGNVDLILCDGKKLTVTRPYNRNRIEGSSINIFGQSGQTGKLIVSAPAGACFSLNGSLKIYGGDIEATPSGSFGMAASEVTIVRGKVNASGSRAIQAYKGKIIISGGNVTAVGDISDIASHGSLYGYIGVELDWTKPTDSISLTGKIDVLNDSKVTIADGKYFTDGAGALYLGELTSEQISAIAGKTLYPACKFTIKGNAPVGVRLNDDGKVTPPTAKPGLTFDGWYTNENLTGEKYNFDAPVTTNTEFYGKYVVEFIDPTDSNDPNHTCTDFTLVTSSTTSWSGTMVASGTVKIDSTVYLTDNVNLILCDGASLTVNGTDRNSAICSNTLNIYGQSGGGGTLAVVSGSGYYDCGIDVTNLTINGGTVISSGYIAIKSINDVIINGGTVTATESSQGIRADNLTIKSGNTTATGRNTGVFIDNDEYNVNGSATFDWTKPTDSITIQNIDFYDDENGSVTFTKPFILSGTNTLATADNIAGKTIVPAYKVTFDVNYQNGKNIIKGAPRTTGKVTKPADPTREGYIFCGWYTTSACETEFDFENKTITEDTIIYAKWIDKYDISSAAVSVDVNKKTVSVMYGTKIIPENEYDVAFYELDGVNETFFGTDYPKMCGTFIAAVTMKSDSPLYKGTAKSAAFTIELAVSGIENVIYTGKAITQNGLKVLFRGKELVPKTDYTVSYKDNTKVGTATVTITGKGNFAAKITETFEIHPADFTGAEFTAENITLKSTGRDQKKKPAFKWNGKAVPAAGYDMIYCAYDTTVDTENPVVVTSFKESYAVLFDGKGNFTGKKIAKVTILDDDSVLVNKTTIKLNKTTFTLATDANDQGYVIPRITVTKGSGKNMITYVEDEDYTLTFVDNDKVGTASVIITGLGGKLSGSVTKTFKINAVSLSTATVTGVVNKTFDPSIAGGMTQTGYKLTLKDGTVLEENADYVVSYKNNTKAGSAQIVFTGIGKYNGTKSVSFKIDKAAVTAANVVCAESAEYRKSGAKPEITVTVNGVTLVLGTDYTVAYAKNTKLNSDKSATATITGKGNYSGKLVYNFKVTQAEITDGNGNLTVTVADQIYNGTAKTKLSSFIKAPTVKDAEGKALSKGNDFEKVIKYYVSADGISFEAITDADLKTNLNDLIAAKFPSHDYAANGITIKAEITLKGNYSGTYSGTYHIATTNISTVRTAVADQPFTGEEIVFDPSAEDFGDIFDVYVTVMGVKTKLVYGTDFEIVPGSYTNNIKKGSASVMIKGLGKYAVTKKVTFKIVANTFGV